MAGRARASSSVTTLPFLDRFELLPWYAACDWIAIPSLLRRPAERAGRGRGARRPADRRARGRDGRRARGRPHRAAVRPGRRGPLRAGRCSARRGSTRRARRADGRRLPARWPRPSSTRELEITRYVEALARDRAALRRSRRDPLLRARRRARPPDPGAQGARRRSGCDDAALLTASRVRRRPARDGRAAGRCGCRAALGRDRDRVPRAGSTARCCADVRRADRRQLPRRASSASCAGWRCRRRGTSRGACAGRVRGAPRRPAARLRRRRTSSSRCRRPRAALPARQPLALPRAAGRRAAARRAALAGRPLRPAARSSTRCSRTRTRRGSSSSARAGRRAAARAVARRLPRRAAPRPRRADRHRRRLQPDARDRAVPRPPHASCRSRARSTISSRARDRGPRHRRRRLHRLAPRRAPASARASTCACSTTSRPAGARTCAAVARRDRADRGRHPRATSASTRRVARLRGRLPPGGAAVGPALDPGPADEQRDERRSGRSTSCSRRATHGVRRVVCASSSSVYGASPELPQARGRAGAADLARTPTTKLAGERYAQASRARLRARDGRAALLQRVRPAPGPDLAVRGRDPELHRRALLGGPADR